MHDFIAISYTNKASTELKERCLSSGLEKKASFFGTIDKFCISEIILPFLPHILGHLSEKPIVINYADVTISEKIGEEAVEKIGNYLDSKSDELSEEILYLIKKCYTAGYLILNLAPKIALYVLECCPAALSYLCARYSHIIVDEYQDTGAEQHKIFVKLAEKGLLAIAVGDLDQSIFGFAGKESKYLYSLANSPNFKVFTLSKNHRCHSSIINYSLKLITKDISLIPTDDLRVVYRNVPNNETGWAELIDRHIEKIKTAYSIEYNKKLAILVRGKRSGQIIAQSLKTPFKFIEDTELDRDTGLWGEVFRGILNIVMDPNANVVDLVTEYFGSFEKDHSGIFNDLLALQIIAQQEGNLISNLKTFFDIARMIHPLGEADHSKAVLEKTLSNAKVLTNFVPAKDNEVQIMTLHKSKGLEFEVVFHVDLNEWILPSYEALKGDKDSLIQDINLHYVGLTRARQCCILLSSSQRTNAQNTVVNASPSSLLFRAGLEALRR